MVTDVRTSTGEGDGGLARGARGAHCDGAQVGGDPVAVPVPEGERGEAYGRVLAGENHVHMRSSGEVHLIFFCLSGNGRISRSPIITSTAKLMI